MKIQNPTTTCSWLLCLNCQLDMHAYAARAYLEICKLDSTWCWFSTSQILPMITQFWWKFPYASCYHSSESFSRYVVPQNPATSCDRLLWLNYQTTMQIWSIGFLKNANLILIFQLLKLLSPDSSSFLCKISYYNSASVQAEVLSLQK